MIESVNVHGNSKLDLPSMTHSQADFNKMLKLHESPPTPLGCARAPWASILKNDIPALTAASTTGFWVRRASTVCRKSLKREADNTQKNALNTDLSGKVAAVTGVGCMLCSAFAKVLARAGRRWPSWI